MFWMSKVRDNNSNLDKQKVLFDIPISLWITIEDCIYIIVIISHLILSIGSVIPVVSRFFIIMWVIVIVAVIIFLIADWLLGTRERPVGADGRRHSRTFLEIQKYISPEVDDEVEALIDELGLEFFGKVEEVEEQAEEVSGRHKNIKKYSI